MSGERPMTTERAYRLGWKASARLGHDLERDESRFIRTHGQAWWNAWSEGWEDYAMDIQPKFS